MLWFMLLTIKILEQLFYHCFMSRSTYFFTKCLSIIKEFVHRSDLSPQVVQFCQIVVMKVEESL
uniref:Putative ovule protein n=1 Tax=Solanum chacoense TaxID=4108 RepID=A0A0V0HFL8_SOLCH